MPDGAELVASAASGLELQLADRVTLAWEDMFVATALQSSYAGGREYNTINHKIPKQTLF